jgi:UDP-N-acetylglucosamine--N-acetylmuramyl-(pentapeptide) pyrophosphoryl-undecaprenol N-acetylglucosamine transferase
MVLHEANALPGLANRVLAPFAERICAGFANVLPGRPVVVTGNPVRYRAQQSAKGESVLALVLGGSEGSPHLNLRGPTLFAELTKLGICCRVLHFCGHNRPQPILAAYQAHGVSAQVEAFSTDLAPAYAQATFAVSCAGALTLSELANSAIPTFLVPLGTAANDHQTANARAFEVAPWFPEQPWNDAAVASAIAHHVSDPVRLDALRCRMRSRAMPDAAERIVEQALQVLEPERPLPRP